MPRLSAHEVNIAELERVVGKQTMELEFLRGALRGTPLQRRAIYLATQMMRITFRATSCSAPSASIGAPARYSSATWRDGACENSLGGYGLPSKAIQHRQIPCYRLSVPWGALQFFKKFPAPFCREFCCKPLNSLADWARKSAQEARILQNSLFFSLLAGNFEVETGSIRAASTATQSGLGRSIAPAWS
jgi:hypothetical protein